MTCIRFFTHGASSYLQLGEQQVYLFFSPHSYAVGKISLHLRNVEPVLTLNLTVTLCSAGWSEPKSTWGHTCRSNKVGVLGKESLRSTHSGRWCHPVMFPGILGSLSCVPLLQHLLHTCYMSNRLVFLKPVLFLLGTWIQLSFSWRWPVSSTAVRQRLPPRLHRPVQLPPSPLDPAHYLHSLEEAPWKLRLPARWRSGCDYLST